MKFTTSTTVAFLALSSYATAFSLMSIRSGSILQYAGIKVVDGKLTIGSGDNFVGTLNSDGTVSANGGYLSINDNQELVISDTGSSSFSFTSDNDLTYNGVQSAIACPNDDKSTYTVYWDTKCDNSVGIKLYSSNIDADASSTEATTEAATNTEATTEAATNTEAATTTGATAEPTATTTGPSNGSEPLVPSYSGAANSLNFGATLAQAGAGLLAYLLV